MKDYEMTTDKQEAALQAISDFGQWQETWEQLENARMIIEKQARRIAELEAALTPVEAPKFAEWTSDYVRENLHKLKPAEKDPAMQALLGEDITQPLVTTIATGKPEELTLGVAWRLTERIRELEAALKKQTEDYRYVFAERDRAWERIKELEHVIDVALEALEAVSDYQADMGFHRDAIATLREVRRDDR